MHSRFFFHRITQNITYKTIFDDEIRRHIHATYTVELNGTNEKQKDQRNEHNLKVMIDVTEWHSNSKCPSYSVRIYANRAYLIFYRFLSEHFVVEIHFNYYFWLRVSISFLNISTKEEKSRRSSEIFVFIFRLRFYNIFTLMPGTRDLRLLSFKLYI